ncbi:hypothetical protein MUP32_04975 [Candidatus Microgenomates bacterium]|nr:hypothetical protein [Candidatus Microgenomates bacterium]
MSTANKKTSSRKQEVYSSYFKLVIILLLLLLTVLVSSQIKYRLSSQSKAQVALPPLPTIDINPQISLDLPQVNITLPPLPAFDIGDNPQPPPIAAPSDIPLRETGNYFIANILPFIIGNLPPGAAEIAQGFFAVIGGRGISPPTSSPLDATPYPTGNRPPTVTPKSWPTDGYTAPTEPPTVPEVPTMGFEKVICSRHITGYVTGCRFGFCLKQDVNETRTPCVSTIDCSAAACLQQARQDAEAEAQNNSASIDWSKSSLSCEVSIGESCN